MNTLTRFVLDHKTPRRSASGSSSRSPRLAALGPANDALSQQFSGPGLEAFETNQAARRDLRQRRRHRPDRPRRARSRRARPSTRPASARQLDAALAKVAAALPDARIASYASTGDRAFVSDDGRTTFALVYIPAKGGVDPGRVEAQAAQAALASVTVGGSPVEVTGLDALRASAGESEGDGTGVAAGDPAGGARRAARPRLRLPLVHGVRAAADGLRRDPDDLPADLAAREHHRRLGDRAVPRRADRAGHRDRLRAARRRPLARGAPAAAHRRTRRPCATRCSTPAPPSSSAARPWRSRCSPSSSCRCRSCAASASRAC